MLIWLCDSLILTFYRSRQIECDCCGWKGNRFFLLTLISGTKVYRLRELCPRCQSLDRQRHLVRYLENKTQISSLCMPTILQIGPSKAVTGWFRKQGLTNIVTIDLRSSTAMLKMDINQLAFRNDIFNIMVCSHVLEHVPDDLMAMREMIRVIKTGGICMIQVPLQPDLLKTIEYDAPNLEEHGHIRAYGQDFVSRLKSVGFEIIYTETNLKEGMFEMTKRLPVSS